MDISALLICEPCGEGHGPPREALRSTCCGCTAAGPLLVLPLLSLLSSLSLGVFVPARQAGIVDAPSGRQLSQSLGEAVVCEVSIAAGRPV